MTRGALGELLRSRRARLSPSDVGLPTGSRRRTRLAAARHPDDPGFADLIRSLHRRSELVRRWWPLPDVTPIGSGVKQLRHPRFGPLTYSHVVPQLADDPSQTLVTFSVPERTGHQDGWSDRPVEWPVEWR